MATPYDVIVIGARCAGSPTAMLLARKGYRVLVVDRATFPSDTVSTHLVHPPGVAALSRWGLLDRVRATGCPPITTYSFDFGPIKLSGSPRPFDGNAQAYCPRRTVLDKILVDAAGEAGAEVREKFTVQELVADDGRVTGIRGHDADGATVTEEATVVVGADGRYSMVAKAVEPEQYNEHTPREGNYYTYWSNLPVEEFAAFIRPQYGWAAAPTNDDLTLVVAGVAHANFDDYRKNVESTYLSMFDSAPQFAELIRGAKREARFTGTGDLQNYFRKPYGPGWALVGDAGYHKDPLTAFGITDAFHDVELLVDALDQSFTGASSFDDAMRSYQQQRDEAATPMFELTLQLAAMEPPPPEMQALFGAMYGNEEAMDGFASVMAGTLPPPEFFSPDNIGRIMAQAGAEAGPQA
jgi:flavin-dependent dehydrogenase